MIRPPPLAVSPRPLTPASPCFSPPFRNTTDVYNPVIVVTPTKDHVHAQLFRTPDINRDTLQADWDRKTVDKLYWERKVSWADVAKQQGSVDRVVPVSEA